MLERKIINPVLKGFNPDPSIVRVGDDYYIATSTFQWFPGVQIHHSRDLIHWKVIGCALTRKSQLDLCGAECSTGVWAPCLTHDGELFHLIYTNMHTFEGIFWDMTNYLVTAPKIEGPWSEPITLNGSGFDPSMFHDDDGRKWLVNMVTGRHSYQKRFSGIILQEYCPKQQKLIGDVHKICHGSNLGFSEGPHIYKRDGWYYLVLAEGGTDYGHAVSIFRSRSIAGQYEPDPQNPILTSADREDLPLQKAGHASLVNTGDGGWYMAHLFSRPLMPEKRSFLGRETAIQKCLWTDEGWLRLANGTHWPDVEVPAPDLRAFEFKKPDSRDDFYNDELDIEYCTLRNPITEKWADLEANPGYLRLRGRQSLRSRFEQSIIARRIQHFNALAQTCVEFTPRDYLTSAGLAAYYNRFEWIYLHITHIEGTGAVLRIADSNKGVYSEYNEQAVKISDCSRVHLRAQITDGRKLRFFYSIDDENDFKQIGGDFDASRLSDEYCQPHPFTGPFFAMCCQDGDNRGCYADFDYFEYSGD